MRQSALQRVWPQRQSCFILRRSRLLSPKKHACTFFDTGARTSERCIESPGAGGRLWESAAASFDGEAPGNPSLQTQHFI